MRSGRTSEHYTEYRTGDKLSGDFRYIALDNTSEPLLNKKIRLGMEDSDTGNNYYDNEYNIFTDNIFADGKYTLSLYSSYIKYLRPLPSGSFGYSPQDYTPMKNIGAERLDVFPGNPVSEQCVRRDGTRVRCDAV